MANQNVFCFFHLNKIAMSEVAPSATNLTKPGVKFSGAAFGVGILIGVVVAILLTWLLHSQRWVYYYSCPHNSALLDIPK